MAKVSTSLVVNFSDDQAIERGRITAEIDRRPDGLNEGRTSFKPGDPVGFLVYLGPGVSLSRIVPTSGAVQNKGGANVPKEENLTFAMESEAQLQAVPAGSVSAQWIGLDGGSYSIRNATVVTPGDTIGVLSVSYTAKALAFVLQGASVPTVLIYIEGDDGA